MTTDKPLISPNSINSRTSGLLGPQQERPAGRRVRVRSLSKSNQALEAPRLPSIPSDTDWVSPFTLPPLPTLRRDRTRSSLHQSPNAIQHSRSGSSAYYAAAWGSPYATPSPSVHSDRFKRNSESEALSPLFFRSPSDRQTPLPEHPGPSSVPSVDSTESPDHPDKQSQRRNWLSESEGSGSDREGELGGTPTKSIHARPPTHRRYNSHNSHKSHKTHRTRESVATVTPETFDGSSVPVTADRHDAPSQENPREELRDRMEQEAMNNEPAALSVATVDKPLPELPPQQRPSLSTPLQSFQRPRKKVLWRGKFCVIALPSTDRDSAGLPPLLTRDELQARLRQWTDLGYPVSGFTVGEWHPHGGTESRSIFPDPHDIGEEGQQSQAQVSIPDQTEWEAWVEYLKEEKLRSLGVTPSNSEPAPSTQSPFSSSLSRVSSTYPSLAGSPSLNGRPGGSNHVRMGTAAFSPVIPTPSPSQIPPSVASSQYGYFPAMGHQHKQSMALPGMQGRISSPFEYPISQPTSLGPGGRSPLDQLGRRQFSPTHKQNVQSIGRTLSPVGSTQSFDSTRTGHSNTQVEQIRRQQELIARQQQQVQAQLAQVQHQRHMPILVSQTRPAEQLIATPVLESPSRTPPEIMHPTPRSHRHNLSAALEKGVGESEDRRGKDVVRSAGKKEPNAQQTQDAVEEGNRDIGEEESVQEDLPVLRRPETIKDGDEKSDIETNPSIAGTPLLIDDQNPFATWQGPSEPPELSGPAASAGHKVQPSMSRFNVQAKEFNPSGMFAAPAAGVGASTFAPSPNKPFPPTARPKVEDHASNVSSLSAFNVEAPAFTPSFMKPASSSAPGHTGQSSVESFRSTTSGKANFDPRSSTFSFSSATFNVDAPEFKPSRSTTSSLDLASSKAATNSKGSIFGDVVINASSKASRRANKAVPVARPRSRDSSQSPSPESEAERDDEQGRPRAPAERQKRARWAESEGDQAPKFADSAPFSSFGEPPNDVADSQRMFEVTEAVESPNEHEPNAVLKAVDPEQDEDSPEASVVVATDERSASAVQTIAEEQPKGMEPTDLADNLDGSASPLERLDGKSLSDRRSPLLEKVLSVITGEEKQPAVDDVLSDPPEIDQPQADSLLSKSLVLPLPDADQIEGSSSTTNEPKTKPSDINQGKEDLPATNAPQTKPEEGGQTSDAKEIVSSAEGPTTKSLESTEQETEAPAIEVSMRQASVSAEAPFLEPVEPARLSSRSSLSAAAAPFVFQPTSREPSITQPPSQDLREKAGDAFQPDPSRERLEKSTKAKGLMASRFAATPPPERSASPERPASGEMARRSSAKSPPLSAVNGTSSPVQELYEYINPNGEGYESPVVKPELAPTRHEPVVEPEDAMGSPIYTDREPDDAPIYVDREPDTASRLPSPSFEELDAVFRQFGDNPGLGVEREETPARAGRVDNTNILPVERSNAPSPAARPSIFYDNRIRDEHRKLGFNPDVHHLNLGGGEVSDWNHEMSPRQEDKIESRARFFDGHVNDIVDGALENRLAPLERTLQAIQHSISLVATKPEGSGRRSLSTDKKDSDADADDEDGYDVYEGYSRYRSQSPRRPSRKQEMIKAAIREALSTYQPRTQEFEIKDALDEMRSLVRSSIAQRPTTELRNTLEDVISTHPGLRSHRGLHGEDEMENLRRKVEGFETMLKASQRHGEDESRRRQRAEDEIDGLLRKLQDSQDEAVDRRSNLEAELKSVERKSAAMEDTLEEYRASHAQWKEDIEEARAKNRDLNRALRDAEQQFKGGLESRKLLRDQIDQLRQRMTKVVEDVVHDEKEWRQREYELVGKNQVLQTALDHETRHREKIQMDADELEKEHKQNLHFRLQHEHAQAEVTRLQSIVASLGSENKSLRDHAHQSERELSTVKDTRDSEAASVSSRLQSELDAARTNVEVVRADLGGQIARLQNQLELSKGDLTVQKSKHVQLSAEMVESHNRALEESKARASTMLEQQRDVHERKLSELLVSHSRSLQNSLEDRGRLEQHMTDKLTLSEDTVKHLEGRIRDLDERLEITKSAARAAVEATTAKGVSLPTAASSVVAGPPHRSSVTGASMPLVRGSDLPEKISPQALRETIMVLQDQLQNREQTIEKLEAEVATLDKAAPMKMRERDTEITMLRELLDVRLEDLQDVISALEQPRFDRAAVKDATIRLKTQLKMEQQLRERTLPAAGLADALPSSLTAGLANLAQSPRAMVAAAAWGNWRKVRDSGITAVTDLATSYNIVSQTPTKGDGSPSRFMSGVMTPPNTGVRSPSIDGSRPSSNPPPPAMRPLAAAAAARKQSSNSGSTSASATTSTIEARPLRGFSNQPRSLSSATTSSGPRPLAKRPSPSEIGSPRTGPTSNTTKSIEPSSTRVGPPSTPLYLNTDNEFGDDVDEDASPLDGKDSRKLSLQDLEAEVVEP